MKALSIKQPWASLIFTPDKSRGVIEGLKSIETRTWKTNYRGPLLICASQKPEPLYHPIDEVMGICRVCGCTMEDACCDEHGNSCHWQNEHRSDICSQCFDITGKAIGIVNLVNCRPFEPADRMQACCEYYPDAYAWELEDPRKLETPFTVKGQLSIFNVKVDSVMLTVKSLAEYPAM